MTVCAGCGHEFQPGDRYIEDAVSGFIGRRDDDPTVDNIMADIFGGNDGKVLLCENCTESGGPYTPKVFYEVGSDP